MDIVLFCWGVAVLGESKKLMKTGANCSVRAPAGTNGQRLRPTYPSLRLFFVLLHFSLYVLHVGLPFVEATVQLLTCTQRQRDALINSVHANAKNVEPIGINFASWKSKSLYKEHRKGQLPLALRPCFCISGAAIHSEVYCVG